MQASRWKVTVINADKTQQRETFDETTAADLLPNVEKVFGEGIVKDLAGTVLGLSSGPLDPRGVYFWTASAGKRRLCASLPLCYTLPLSSPIAVRELA
jgi:hypothetical protein